jgi:hypothetical protein
VVTKFVPGVDQKFNVPVPVASPAVQAAPTPTRYTKSTIFQEVTVDVNVICDVPVSV